MKIDDKIRNEKLQCNISREAEKDQHYCQVKLINMSILKAKKYCHLIKVKKIKHAKFTDSALGKAFGKTNKIN